ncbi:MAG TPA: hypothetical protein VNG89_12785 [Vicinamibacterales bacterium]|nr:hypothetical protein [Vicinamibacterales bacterium]
MAALVSAAFIAAWAAVAGLVMVVTLYLVRLIPMTGWRAADKQPAEDSEIAGGRRPR